MKGLKFGDRLREMPEREVDELFLRWHLWIAVLARNSRMARPIEPAEIVNTTYLDLVEEDEENPPVTDYDINARFRGKARTKFHTQRRQDYREKARSVNSAADEVTVQYWSWDDLREMAASHAAQQLARIPLQPGSIFARYAEIAPIAAVLGLSTEEIAAKLGISVKQVYRARERLAALTRQKFGEPQ